MHNVAYTINISGGNLQVHINIYCSNRHAHKLGFSCTFVHFTYEFIDTNLSLYMKIMEYC